MSDISKIVDALNQWYHPEVRAIADELIKECREANPADPDEWMADRLHETIDSHEFVIYTYKARLVLVASDNSDVVENELDESGTPEQQAYWAMRADVEAHLAARHYEWSKRADD